MTKRTQVARVSCRVIVTRALAGLSFAGFLLLAAPASLALPLYASREGRTCVSCHYDPNGGGMRNDVGFVYCKNRHGVDAEERWAAVTVVQRLNDWISIGLDTRVLYLATHAKGGPTIGTSTFFPMQGQLNFAVSPHQHLTVVSSHGIQIDPDRYEVRELYGLIHDLPHDVYLQVGRFRLPFGLRQDDHTSYIRTVNFLPYDSQFDHAGIEIGAAGRKYFGQLSFTNATGTISSEQAQTLAGKIGMAGQRLAVGISGFHQYRRDSASVTDDRWAIYAMTTHGRLTGIVEYGGGTEERQGISAGERNLLAAFGEVDCRAARGVNLRGRIDYLEPDMGPGNHVYRRWLLETDVALIPFTEVKLSYRSHNEEGLGEYEEYLVQFFFPF